MILTINEGTGISAQIRFEIITCYKCKIAFAVTADHRDRLVKNKDSFFCPAGHSQAYIGETEAEKLKAKLAEVEREKIRETNFLRQQLILEENKGKKVKRDLNRLKKGVCPCCNRSFENLHNHLQTQHPEYAGKKVSNKLHVKISKK